MRCSAARRGTFRAGFLAAAALMLAPGAFADAPAVLEPDAESPRFAQVDLKASRLIGFAPMTVVLTGHVRDDKGRTVALGPGAATRLTVESASLSLPDGAIHTPVLSAVPFDEAGPGPDDPVALRLLLNRPGKYTVRLLVVEDGQERLSRPIELRVI